MCSHDRACSKWVDAQLILVLDAWTYITSNELTYINLLEFSFCAMYRSPRLFWLLALAVCFSMRRKIWKLVVWCGGLGCCKELEVAFVRGKFCLFRGALLNLNRVPKSLVLLCFEAKQPLAPFWSGMSWTTELDVWCVYKHCFVWPHVCGKHGKDQGQHDRQVTDVTDQQFLFLFHWCCICNLNIDSQVDWLEANGYEVASKQGRGGPDKCLFVLIYACPLIPRYFDGRTGRKKSIISRGLSFVANLIWQGSGWASFQTLQTDKARQRINRPPKRLKVFSNCYRL